MFGAGKVCLLWCPAKENRLLLPQAVLPFGFFEQLLSQAQMRVLVAALRGDPVGRVSSPLIHVYDNGLRLYGLQAEE